MEKKTGFFSASSAPPMTCCLLLPLTPGGTAVNVLPSGHAAGSNLTSLFPTNADVLHSPTRTQLNFTVAIDFTASNGRTPSRRGCMCVCGGGGTVVLPHCDVCVCFMLCVCRLVSGVKGSFTLQSTVTIKPSYHLLTLIVWRLQRVWLRMKDVTEYPGIPFGF